MKNKACIEVTPVVPMVKYYKVIMVTYIIRFVTY